MSHIVSIQTRLHDPATIAAACRRLNLPAPTEGTVTIFSGEATGIIVQLPEWHYPLVIDVLTGVVRYDNFQGHWGAQVQLDRFMQAYAVEMTKQQARRKGYSVNEQTLENGSIRVEIIEG